MDTSPARVLWPKPESGKKDDLIKTFGTWVGNHQDSEAWVKFYSIWYSMAIKKPNYSIYYHKIECFSI
jgi:hypothetical protein